MNTAIWSRIKLFQEFSEWFIRLFKSNDIRYVQLQFTFRTHPYNASTNKDDFDVDRITIILDSCELSYPKAPHSTSGRNS